MRHLAAILLIVYCFNLPAQNNGVTMEICDLDPIDKNIEEVSYYNALTSKCGSGIEAWSKQDSNLIKPSFHPIIQALHYSYAYHRPLSISPDMIWLLIAQGFSTHVNENPDSIRHFFVDFNGKKVLKVKRNNFTKGSNTNDWESVFPEFTEQIGNYTGEKLLNTTLLNFSTTGKNEKAAFEVALMEAMSSYFIYAVYTSCGITKIRLEGTVSDWELILLKAIELRQYNLSWWIDELVPVLEQFVKASKNQVDVNFWEQIYKNNVMGSGTPHITGWILKFFPYLKVGEKNVRTDQYKRAITSENFPSGISKADFYWMYYGKVFQMEFLAGFVGVKQNPETLELSPEIGWTIRDTNMKGIKKEDKEYEENILTSPKK